LTRNRTLAAFSGPERGAGLERSEAADSEQKELVASLLAVALVSRSAGASTGIAALIAASLVFYGWWDVRALAVIGASIAINYALARQLAGDRIKRRLLVMWMWIGISLNLT